MKQIIEQNGSVRLFMYDSQRRLIADAVITLGAGVDGLVRKIGRTYTSLGEVERVTTYDNSNDALNEIKYEYDANRRLKRLYQSHSGEVAPTTQYLEYTFDDANYGRLAGVQYPNGKQLSYIYDARNNITQIKDSVNPLVEYLYDGMGSTMQTTYLEPDVSLTYANGGLDRFGRVVNHSWMKDNDPLVHIIHGYDYAGNRTYRHDAVHAANSELYDYDQINQIKSLDRGVLNQNKDSVTVSNFTESWDFDKTGNWLQYDKNGTVENRTHNAANELQGIASHDANGNMTVMPDLKAKYDAWNRLVEVRHSSDNLIARYDYNGVNQRIQKTIGSSVTKSFFNEQWQELESVTGSELTTYVWGLRYIDDLVLREKGEERLYSLADPNWNVVAITNSSGAVQERMKYDAFGKITWLDYNFVAKANSDYSWNRTFTGQVFDTETGLMFYRNRYYHIGLGRFINRDPIGYEGRDSNLYRYVKNSSIVFLDPNGLRQCGPRVWVYTGSWCVEDNVWYAALEAAGNTGQARCAAILPSAMDQIAHLVAQYMNSGLGSPDVFPLHPNNPHQHCVWNCRMVRRWSEIDPTFADALAIQLSEQKEQIDNKMADIRDNLLSTDCYRHLPPTVQKILNDHANSANQPADYTDNATGRDCGRLVYATCPPSNPSPIWTDTACEDCCTTAGVGPGTPEGPGTPRPWGPRHIPGL